MLPTAGTNVSFCDTSDPFQKQKQAGPGSCGLLSLELNTQSIHEAISGVPQVCGATQNQG